jgi:hypothetical protein
MNTRIHPVFAVLAAAALGALVGACGSSGTEPAGALTFELQAAPGVELNQANYVVSGNGLDRSGTLDLAGSTVISAHIGNIPEGNGYRLSLTATSVGATGVACQGQATFDVRAGATTHVMIRLQCRLPSRTGSVLVTGTVNLCPRIDAVDVLPAEAIVGRSVTVSAAAADLDGAPTPIAFAWTSTAGPVAAPIAARTSVQCAHAGARTVTLTVTDGDCTDTVTVPVTCTAPPADAGADGPTVPAVVINEVESNGGVPKDWVEFHNPGTAPVDLSGWVFKDNNDANTYTLSPGTVIAPGGYLVLDETVHFNFGLGAPDEARLFDATGRLVDAYGWTSHAATTYGRCPDGAGAFATTLAPTKGAPNACGSVDAGTPDMAAPVDGAIALEPWPGQDNVVVADLPNQFPQNLSGLTYEPPAGSNPGFLWAVLNGPGVLFRLVWNGTHFVESAGWAGGKTLRFPTGVGNPDSEGVSRGDYAQPYIYVATERDNDASGVSRLSVLRFDTSAPGPALVATQEWNLTSALPSVGPNLGLEVITWIPDGHLVARGFIDESRGGPYDPAVYPEHAGGVFAVGVEGTAQVHLFLLAVDGSAHRLATFASGLAGVMSVEYDRDVRALWISCDNLCQGVQHVFGLDAGRFVLRRAFARPRTLPDSNNEGTAMASEAECVGGFKRYVWSDDSRFAGHALRMDSIPCGPLFP